jgi:hypothetical protein
MSHARRQLRDAVVAAGTGARVYTGRVYPLAEAELPSLVVNTVSEEAEPVSLDLDTAIVQRQVEIEVVATVRATAALADALDAVAEDVETALAGSVTVGSIAVPLAYAGCDIEFSGEADQPIGRASLRYTATLYTLANAPGTLVQA